ATAEKTTQGKLSRSRAIVDTDSDLESVQLLHSPEPGTNSQRRDGPKRSSEGMKAKALYKAALRIQDRLQKKAALSPAEKAKLTWAEEKIAEGRLHFAKLPHMSSTGGFANKVEETLANKRQRSTEGASMDAPGSKRQRGPKEAGPPQMAKKPKKKTQKSVSRKMTEAQWKMVHARLIESLYARMEDDPEAPMPTFDGAGWLNGVKILKCMDDPTRKWLTQAVCQLEALWEGAKLKVVDRELIPSTPKAKVLVPIAIQADRALKLLQLKLGITDNAKCRKCDESEAIETLEHLICKCPALTRARMRYLGSPVLASLEDASRRKPGELLAFAKKHLDIQGSRNP
ncbi:hypothetical protein KR059_010498, partial [Drosophila kikkawai]